MYHRVYSLGLLTAIFNGKTIMNDKTLTDAIKDLRKFLKKVKPKYHYVRGWEDMRWMMLETLDELEYRSKYMDDKMIKYKKEK